MIPNELGSVARRPNTKPAPSRLNASRRSTASLPNSKTTFAGVRSTISANASSKSKPTPTVRIFTRRRRSRGQSANASAIMTNIPNALMARSRTLGPPYFRDFSSVSGAPSSSGSWLEPWPSRATLSR